MKVLFRDEKQKAETIEILSDLMKDAALTGNPQVSNEDNTFYHSLSPLFAASDRPLLGTKLTCKTIRGSKRWRQIEENLKINLVGHMKYLASTVT